MKRIVLFSTLLFLGFTHSYSQDLTWEEVAKIAEAHNPDLLASRSAVNSSEAKYRAAFGNFLPQLTGSADYSKSKASGNDTQNDYSYALTLQQSLFSGLKTKANVELTKTQLKSANVNLALIESQVAADLKSGFVSLLTAQENVLLLKKIGARRAENKKLIELRYEAGRENYGSYLRAKAQLSQAQFEVVRAERDLIIAQRNLARIMGKEKFFVVTVTGTLNVKMEPGKADFASLTLETPSYQKELLSLSETKTGINLARSSLFPLLSFSASGRRRGNDFPPNDSDNWNLGFSVSYPFFSGGQDYFNIQQAKFEVQKASINLDGKRREIEVSLEQSFLNLQDAISFAEVQKQFLEAAEERAQIARAQYTTGLLSFQDWDTIETDLINSQKQTLSSLRDAVLSDAEWRKAQGKGLKQ